MNDHVTISTFQLFARFPDAESARLYLEGRLWPAGPVCPECRSSERITARKGGYYRCNACPNDYTFTVRTGTIFERSHVPLHKWVYAMYLLVTARKGISSLQLSKEIGVTQKSAWFMLQRLREGPPRRNNGTPKPHSHGRWLRAVSACGPQCRLSALLPRLGRCGMRNSCHDPEIV